MQTTTEPNQEKGNPGQRLISVRIYLLSAAFLLTGASLFTYGATKTRTTELVLTRAWNHVSDFLEERDLRIGVSNIEKDIPAQVDLDSRELQGQVLHSGGMYFGWNDMIPYFGAGVFLVLVGLLIPTYRPRRRTNR